MWAVDARRVSEREGRLRASRVFFVSQRFISLDPIARLITHLWSRRFTRRSSMSKTAMRKRLSFQQGKRAAGFINSSFGLGLRFLRVIARFVIWQNSTSRSSGPHTAKIVLIYFVKHSSPVCGKLSPKTARKNRIRALETLRIEAGIRVTART